jgi:hypothetical protein
MQLRQAAAAAAAEQPPPPPLLRRVQALQGVGQALRRPRLPSAKPSFQHAITTYVSGARPQASGPTPGKRPPPPPRRRRRSAAGCRASLQWGQEFNTHSRDCIIHHGCHTDPVVHASGRGCGPLPRRAQRWPATGERRKAAAARQRQPGVFSPSMRTSVTSTSPVCLPARSHQRGSQSAPA